MNIDNLITECENRISSFYEGGRGKKSTDLKNYTSGDHEFDGMESVLEDVIWDIVNFIGFEEDQVEIHNKYFQSDYNLSTRKDPKDPQRMDFHIKVGDKHPLIIESRAWIDKPFYTLKRGVVRNFMKLDYVREQLTEDVKFLNIALCADVMPRLIESLDITQGFGDRVKMVSLSPFRRGYKKGNYFDHGYDKESVRELVTFIHNHLSKHK